jgi:release factor glutamine methyltransferase
MRCPAGLASISPGHEVAVKILAPPGVFAPHTDSLMLAERVARAVAPGALVLDLCAGSGAIAIAAARAGAEATAVDVSRRAVLATRLNAVRNGVRVRAIRGDLFEPVAGERFDVIASNPPYLPGPTDELPGSGPSRAWEGGANGRLILDRIISGVAEHLRPGGVAMVVHSSVCGIDESLERFRAAGLEAAVAERRTGRLGPLLAARVDLLERRGLVPAGSRREDLVVISARAGSPRSRVAARHPERSPT